MTTVDAAVAMVEQAFGPCRHYPPSDKASLPGHLSTKVVGVSSAEGYPAQLHRLADLVARGRAPELVLVHDADNPHDASAVAVRSAATGRHLGHLPAALAARVAPDAGAWSIEAYEVLVMPGSEAQPGLSLHLRRGAA
jgi:hypothetical protein